MIMIDDDPEIARYVAAHGVARLDLAAQVFEMGRERARNPLRAGAWKRPAIGMPGQQQHQADRGGCRPMEREERMSGATRERGVCRWGP